MPQFWVEHRNGVLIAVRVRPGARRAAVGGLQDAAMQTGWPSARLRLAVTEPPEAGRATKAVVAALMSALNIPGIQIMLQAGTTARDKLLLITPDSLALRDRLATIAAEQK